MSAPKLCRYCDRAERTKEHALAQQLAGLIPQPPTMTAERRTVTATGGELLSAWHPSTPASVEVRDFCSGCNGGFMNDMDHSVKAEFEQLCRGNALILHSEAIERWAAWTTKQYFSYQPAYPEDYSRNADYHAFYRSRRPLTDMHVYLGLGDGLPWPHLHGRRPMFLSPVLSKPGDVEREVGLQVWTAAYCQLVVQVVHLHDNRLPVPLRGADQPAVRLWPDPPPVVDLQTRARIDEAGLATLTKLKPLLDPVRAGDHSGAPRADGPRPFRDAGGHEVLGG